MPTPLRRLLLWTFVCAISAAPSYFFAREDFDRTAMVVGVCLFIVAYTAVTSTRIFNRFHQLPFIRRTLYIGYGLRIALSLAFVIAFKSALQGFSALATMVILADGYPGFLSVQLIKSIGFVPETFLGTLLTTIVQGTLLNAIIFVIMAVAYAVQRLFLKPPSPEGRGIDVILPSSR